MEDVVQKFHDAVIGAELKIEKALQHEDAPLKSLVTEEPPAQVTEQSPDRSAYNCPDCLGEGLDRRNQLCPKCGGTGKV